jgi:hypothetical protein
MATQTANGTPTIVIENSATPPATTPAATAAAPLDSATPPPAAGDAPPTPPPDPFQEKFDRLAARSQEIAKREREIKAARAKLDEYEELRGLAGKDRIAAVGKLGINVDDLLVDLVKSSDGSGEQKAKESPEVSALRKELESIRAETKRKEDAARAAEIDRRYEQFRASTIERVSTAGEKYEALNALGLQSQVADIQEGFFNRTGEHISFEEAAELAEKKAVEWARRAHGIKKLGFATHATEQASNGQSGTRGKVLSNSMAAPSGTNVSQETKRKTMTREESMAEAVRAVMEGRSPYLHESTADA